MSTGPTFPRREDAVLRYVLDRRAAEDPDKPFVVFDGGPTWTRAELRSRVRRVAASLEQLGVKQGDHVVVWLPNGPEVLTYFFALNYIGAVFVPMNTSYRGGVLGHALRMSDADLAIIDAALAPRLGEVEDRGRLTQVVAVGSKPKPVPGLRFIGADDLPDGGDSPSEPEQPIEPWDTQAIMYTSGTTGPSKAVLCSYMQAYVSFNEATMPFLTGADRFLINMPFFHIGGTTLTYTMLVNGGSIAMVDRFSGSQFWTQIRETESTIVFLLGVMASFVQQADPTPSDADNPLTKVFMVPLVDDVPAFSKRFGLDIYTIYNMTELSAPLLSEVNPTLRGTCGRVRPGIEVRLVDAADREVPAGQVGEILVRTEQPWALNHGYYKMPEATATAWRNGWFHTGDSARRDDAGNFFFADRLKDSIRRRGENISSMEVEVEVLAHPHVREAAVVAVPSEVAEDEVLAVVAARPGRSIDPAELIQFLIPRMAYYMVPRYVRIVDETQDRHREDPEGQPSRPRPHRGHLGPREGGNQSHPLTAQRPLHKSPGRSTDARCEEILMRAAYVQFPDATNPLSALVVGHRPEPQPTAGWSRIKVSAASLNHHDVFTLRGVGVARRDLPMILGCDAAGFDESGRRVVVHAVINQPDWTGPPLLDPGLSVLSEKVQGSFAEFIGVPTTNVLPLPDGVDFDAAACLPTAWVTAHHMLFCQAGLVRGDTVLVQGASGGLAAATVQPPLPPGSGFG